LDPPPPLLIKNIFCFIFGGTFLQVGVSFWGKNFKIMKIQGNISRGLIPLKI